jgi:hypothetical protein
MAGGGVFECRQPVIATNVLSSDGILGGVECAVDVGRDTTSSSAR